MGLLAFLSSIAIQTASSHPKGKNAMSDLHYSSSPDFSETERAAVYRAID